jgi:hypothetical protein
MRGTEVPVRRQLMAQLFFLANEPQALSLMEKRCAKVDERISKTDQP